MLEMREAAIAVCRQVAADRPILGLLLGCAVTIGLRHGGRGWPITDACLTVWGF